MHDWMVALAPHKLSRADEKAFEAALSTRDVSKLSSVPRWVFLHWLTHQGLLLHGSSRADLTLFEPRAPKDLSPDDFSKRTAVFAASDGVWAMMYALRDRAHVNGMLNMALQIEEQGEWSPVRHFLSFSPVDSSVTDGRDLLREGSVYVLPRHNFEQMPAYEWPGLGKVLEPHWVNPLPVRPVMRVPVSPKDFPLPVRTHDAARVNSLSQSDPWGFPWLEPAPHPPNKKA